MKLYQWILLTIFVLSASCAPRLARQDALLKEEDSAIIDGTPVSTRTSMAAKSVVYLEFLDGSFKVVGYCSGTLIASKFILTAAHCFDSTLMENWQSFNVVFEDRIKDVGNRTFRAGVDFKTHPKYDTLSKNPRLYDHDIAVAMFKGGIPAGFMTVQIDMEETASYADTEVYVYGYGRAYDYKGDVTDFGSGGAGFLRRGTMRVNGDYNETEDRYFITAQSPTYVCQGDSGGPQFYNKDKVLKVIGVNSAAVGDRLPSGKSVCRGKTQVTKVAPFSSWILNEQKNMLNYNQ